MDSLKQLTPQLQISGQLQLQDIATLAASGITSLINNRPDNEEAEQPDSAQLAAVAAEQGLAYLYLPIVPGKMTAADAATLTQWLIQHPGPALAFCRTGNRSTQLWTLSQAASTADYDVLIVGGGAAGCAVAASLLSRAPHLRLALIEPQETHYYQPGWTLVGAGVMPEAQTARPMQRCIPAGVQWIKGAVTHFEPEQHRLVLADKQVLSYRALVVCPGLVMNWAAIEGLTETLGKNGVTSNYQPGLAAYTWQLVQNLQQGNALFTQPPMPIKCAGAPQKALYLSCDWWRQQGVLNKIKVDFCNAGAVLFGVAHFVPTLMKYMTRYQARLHFNTTLTAVDGPAKKAWFRQTDADGNSQVIEKSFDMLHVVPPQQAPEFIRQSPLANADGWLEVDRTTLQHPRYHNVFSLGDVCSSPNAKTVAAVRKQAPIVACNLLDQLAQRGLSTRYDGYGACPLTVERGKVVLAEFGFEGKLLPSFPLEPATPRRLAWMLKAHWMPKIYFNLMLRGREWLAKPTK